MVLRKKLVIWYAIFLLAFINYAWVIFWYDNLNSDCWWPKNRVGKLYSSESRSRNKPSSQKFSPRTITLETIESGGLGFARCPLNYERAHNEAVALLQEFRMTSNCNHKCSSGASTINVVSGFLAKTKC
jgi:hypothetical protein